MKRIFYILVGLAAFFIVYQNAWQIGVDIYDWWDERNYEPTYSDVPTEVEIVNEDGEVERVAVNRVALRINNFDYSPTERRRDGGSFMAPRRYLITPVMVMNAYEFPAPGEDEIIVTGSRAGAAWEGLPDLSRFAKTSADGTITSPRYCAGVTFPNFIIHDRDTSETWNAFDVRLAVANHQTIFTDGEASHIVFIAAILDTNGDKRLSCSDHLFLGSYRLADRSLRWLDLGDDEPPAQTSGEFLTALGDGGYVMKVGVDENGDGVAVESDEAVELAIIDVDAMTARRVVTREDLKRVQRIMYKPLQTQAP